MGNPAGLRKEEKMTTDFLQSEYTRLKERVRELEIASLRVFNWYFIFGEDNLSAREHLANLGNVLKFSPLKDKEPK